MREPGYINIVSIYIPGVSYVTRTAVSTIIHDTPFLDGL